MRFTNPPHVVATPRCACSQTEAAHEPDREYAAVAPTDLLRDCVDTRTLCKLPEFVDTAKENFLAQ